MKTVWRNPSVWPHVRALLAPRTASMLLLMLFVLAGAGLEIVPQLLLQHAIDTLILPGVRDGIVLIGVLSLVAWLLLQATGFGTRWMESRIAKPLLRDLRVRLFAHLQRLPMRYFDETPIGEVISRCTSDVDAMESVLASTLVVMLRETLRLLTLALAMFVLSPLLAVLGIGCMLPLMWFTRGLQARALAAERAGRKAVGEVSAHVQEALAGSEEILAFDRAAQFVQRTRHVLHTALRAVLLSTRWSSLFTPLMLLMLSVVLAGLLVAGALGARSGLGLSIGTLIAFIGMMRRFFAPITNIGEEWQAVQAAIAGAERVFDVLGQPADARSPQAMQPQSNDGVLVLDNVSFGYREGQPVLQAVSLVLRAGEHVAMVGRTGAGKSSVLQLAAGLYQPWHGQVRVQGLAADALTPAQRQQLLGVVPQMTQLFAGSIAQNIAGGDDAVSDAQIENALLISGAAEVISQLRDGLQTQLQANGAPLSSGQRQFVALARALLHEPALLLLDEATAALDPASDAQFRAALRSAKDAKNRAILTVAHRLTTALAADRIILLEQGRIVEAGTPAALIEQGGRFAAMLALEQAGWNTLQR